MNGSPQTKAKTPEIPAQMKTRFKLNPSKIQKVLATPKTAPKKAPNNAWINLNNITQTLYTTAAIARNKAETADLLRKHGGKTGVELKAEGKWNTSCTLQSQL